MTSRTQATATCETLGPKDLESDLAAVASLEYGASQCPGTDHARRLLYEREAVLRRWSYQPTCKAADV